LEERLLNYSGTLLLISHDRALLDHVVTSILAFEGDGVVRESVGGYEDWLRQRPPPVTPVSVPEVSAPATQRSKPRSNPKRATNKLSFKEARELAELPGRIESLEQEQTALHARLADPRLYQGDGTEVVTVKARLGAVDAELEAAYARWEALAARE
jgi:ATPase components of ABC transporters with duplicated ATPase domains